LRVWLDRPYGYNDVYCISCTSGSVKFPRETVTYDNYRLTLPSKCTYAMSTNPDAPKDVTFIHDDLENSNEDLKGFKSFFNNKYKTDCPVKKCELL